MRKVNRKKGPGLQARAEDNDLDNHIFGKSPVLSIGKICLHKDFLDGF